MKVKVSLCGLVFFLICGRSLFDWGPVVIFVFVGQLGTFWALYMYAVALDLSPL